MRITKRAALLLVGILLLAHSTPVYAQESTDTLPPFTINTDVSPQWTNINDIQLDLYFENGEAGCSGIITGASGTSSITATFKLERKNSSGWSLEKSWKKNSDDESLSFYGTEDVSRGYTYRLTVTTNVTRNGVTETASTWVEDKYN